MHIHKPTYGNVQPGGRAQEADKAGRRGWSRAGWSAGGWRSAKAERNLGGAGRKSAESEPGEAGRSKGAGWSRAHGQVEWSRSRAEVARAHPARRKSRRPAAGCRAGSPARLQPLAPIACAFFRAAGAG